MLSGDRVRTKLPDRSAVLPRLVRRPTGAAVTLEVVCVCVVEEVVLLCEVLW